MAAPLVVIDTGCANIASVCFALERLGARPEVTGSPCAVAEAERAVFPGVGAAGFAMERLKRAGLTAPLKARTGPTLGVCLGMQLMYEGTDEDGGVEGLGLFAGQVRRFAPHPDRPVPHMGWNTLEPRAGAALLGGVQPGDYAYFVHSYAAPVNEDAAASCDYGQPFAAAAERGRFFGCQFHPERSAATGAAILKAFLETPL